MTSPVEEKEKLNPLLASQQPQSLGDYFRGYVQRLASGDLGSLPIIIGLIVIAIIFQNANQNFLTPQNFVNLILQMSGTTMIAYGVVFVLLLGEIDLSIGYVSAVAGVSVAILLQQTDAFATAANPPVAGLPWQASLYLFLHQWGIALFPLVLMTLYILWHSSRKTNAALYSVFAAVLTLIVVPFALYGFNLPEQYASVQTGFDIVMALILLVVLLLMLFFNGKNLLHLEITPRLLFQLFILGLLGLALSFLFRTVQFQLSEPFVGVFLFLQSWLILILPLVFALIVLIVKRDKLRDDLRSVLYTTLSFVLLGAFLGFLPRLFYTETLETGIFQVTVIYAQGWTWFSTFAFSLLVTIAIGLLHGSIITIFRVPSFIVTLAGLLGWNGVVLKIIGNGGTVIIQDQTIVGIANSYLPKIWEAVDPIIIPVAWSFTENFNVAFNINLGKPVFSWGMIVLLLGVLGFAIVQLFQFYSRRSQGLSTRPIVVIAGQIFFLALAAFLVAHISDQNRGVPVVGIILLVFLIFLNFVTNNTQFGRFIYAVGGNAEAARRAGINVTQIRVLVFIISSVLAGFGGIILAARLRSVATDAGGGNLLLNAIASAVIGGTSLFGGRGHVSSAVLGALVIIGVDNGMGLLNLSSGDKFIITGIVLLVAVIVDALSQRRQQQSGLR